LKPLRDRLSMTTTNQAFIKAYRKDEPQPAPSNPAIAGRVGAVAEGFGLPDAARQVQIHRDERARRIFISARYSERVELPGFVRILHFTPRAEGTY
jgi:hypothetical protein